MLRASSLPVGILLGLVLGLAGPARAAEPLDILALLGVDAANAVVPIGELVVGALPQTGIPALGFGGDWTGAVEASPTPTFVGAQEASSWLDPEEPVIVVNVAGEVRAYPIQILIWHELVNDEVGGVPIVVSFCPLCNSAIAFDRRVPLDATARDALLALNPEASLIEPDEPYLDLVRAQRGGAEPVGALTATFGVSGMLYNSNVIMFDDHSSTLWSQLLGEAVAGSLSGLKLLRYPTQLVSFAEFRSAFPDAPVLSRDTGYARGYGSSLYIGYDGSDSPLFHFRGRLDERLDSKARVVAVVEGGAAVAFPFDNLTDARAVNASIGDRPLAVFWQEGTRSALDTAAISQGRDVGSVAVFRRDLAGRVLTFGWDGEAFVDDQTGTRWDLFGRAIEGALAGEQLEPVVHYNTLWFAWAAFHPDTLIHQASEANSR